MNIKYNNVNITIITETKGGEKMENLCKKFPKICNCPHKDKIDKDLQNNKSPYYISKWLSKTECPISAPTIRKYQNYLKECGELKPPEITIDNEEIDEVLLKKLRYAANNVDFDNMNPNVQVQWVLGLYKILFGDKKVVNADIESKVTLERLFDDNLINDIIDGGL